MRKVLILIDCQNDFCAQGGVLANKESIAIAKDIAKTLPELVSEKGFDYIVATRDTHYRQSYDVTVEGKHLPVLHCICETAGWCLRDDIMEVLDNCQVPKKFINKHTFGYNNWEQIIGSDKSEAREFYLVGFCTDICVVTNALVLKTLYPNSEVYVYEGLTAGVTPEKKEAAIETMRSCHINII